MSEINTSEDRQLLYIYLKKLYGDKQAKKLMLDNKDNLFGFHGLAWATGKRSLEYFSLYFLSNVYLAEGNAEIAPVHYEMWEGINDMILKQTHDKQVDILPRGTGKSLFGSLSTSLWTSLYKHKTYTVIASAIGDTAETFIRNIKMAVDGNKRIEEAFGKMYDARKYINNSEKVEFANRTMIQSISAASTLRGKSYNNKRIELLLLDDYQKDEEVATDEQREKKWKRFSDDVNYAMQKDNSTMLALGTVQHKEDFYSRLMKSPTWKSRQEKAILVDDVDELFNTGLWAEFKRLLTDKDNENRLDYAKEYYFQNKEDMQYPLLWQSYWDCMDVALQYYENPISFKQEMQGDVDSIGEKRFKTIITESPEQLEDEERDYKKTMLVIDPAGTRTKRKGDFHAFVVGSVVSNGVKYVRKGIIARLEFEEYMATTLEILRQYPDITHVFIEKNTYNGSDVVRLEELIAADKELSKRNIIWINEHQHRNKDNKIDMIVGDVNMGRIIFNEEDVEAIEQLKDFAGCEHSLFDDFPDAVAQFNIEISKLEEEVKKLKFFDRGLLF